MKFDSSIPKYKTAPHEIYASAKLKIKNGVLPTKKSKKSVTTPSIARSIILPKAPEIISIKPTFEVMLSSCLKSLTKKTVMISPIKSKT